MSIGDKNEGAARVYIKRVVKNLVVDKHRREAAMSRGGDRHRIEDDEEGNGVERFAVAGGKEIGHDVQIREQVRLMDAALDGANLSELQRSVLKLKREGNKTENQIAEELREPIGSVKSARFYGQEKVREFMELETDEQVRRMSRRGQPESHIALALEIPSYRVRAILDGEKIDQLIAQKGGRSRSSTGTDSLPEPIRVWAQKNQE